MTQVATLEWQRPLFATPLNRYELLQLRPNWNCAEFTLRIHRNHGVEQVASVLGAFLAFCGLSANIEISSYDDSLQFSDGSADVELIWLDYSHYDRMNGVALCRWLSERLSVLREQSHGTIVAANATMSGMHDMLVNEWLAQWASSAPGAVVLDILPIVSELGSAAFDFHRQPLTATCFSDAACLEMSRLLGLQVLPNILLPGIKAIAVDLDGTLYQGVLGEDGPDGVVLTPGHRALQERLANLNKQGIILVIASKNDPQDVERLFAARRDFPLNASHISDWRITWKRKSHSLACAATRLRMGPEAFLLLDNNIGELHSVGIDLPEVKLLLAQEDPRHTLDALRFYPGLISNRSNTTDMLRTADIRANEIRTNLAATFSDPTEYIRGLDVKISLAVNEVGARGRLAEMCRKTNQFNLATMRFDEIQIGHYLSDPSRRALTVSLRDRLADSGLIAALLLHQTDDALVVDELCISCRVLGRHLEDAIVAAAVERIMIDMPRPVVQFAYRPTSRNQVARDWLSQFTGSILDPNGGLVGIPWSHSFLEAVLAKVPVSISSDATL